ncbi:Biopolymer transport protein ExbD [bacterium HR19]|nr:Biopolymer transport protein ExbD [bacterium HR19]
MEFKKDSQDYEASINMIPLIDIMLVLLIIFMITAPVLKYSFDVDVPSAQTSQATEQTEDIPLIVINKLNEIRINGLVLKNYDELKKYVSELKRKEILIEAEKSISYGIIVKVMDILKQAGVEKIGLVTQKEKEL